jgi:hypothetical protein
LIRILLQRQSNFESWLSIDPKKFAMHKESIFSQIFQNRTVSTDAKLYSGFLVLVDVACKLEADNINEALNYGSETPSVMREVVFNRPVISRKSKTN